MIRSDEDAFYRAVHDFYKTNGADGQTYIEGESMTRQEFAEECDINTIMKRYEGHGQSINHLNVGQPMYVDFSEMPTNLMDYMAFMQTTEAAFMSLSARVRREFDNDARLFVDFASNPANLEQMREWGLAPPAKPQVAPEMPSPAQGAPQVPQVTGGAPTAPTHGST